MLRWFFHVRCSLIASLCMIATCSVTKAEPKPSQQESWITFLSRRTGDNVLYRMRPDGSQCTPVFGGIIKDAPGLAEGTTLYREPHWTWQSPDRQYFVSCAYDLIRPSEKNGLLYEFALHLGRTDGTGPTVLIAPGCAEAAAWSLDSKRVAFSVLTKLESVERSPARVSRVYIASIDRSKQQLVVERPGVWHPLDWSPNGKNLLLRWSEFIDEFSQERIFELDMQRVEQQEKDAPNSKWQRFKPGILKDVFGTTAPIEPNDARYSPDGKFLAVTGMRKRDKPGPRESLDFELGVFQRSTGTYKKVAWYKEGLRGPICWSADGSEILFSRPLKEGDNREGGKEDPGASRQQWELGLWAIRPDGTGERFVTTGWSPDCR